MTSITSELGQGIRRLHRRPASALGIVVTLALGIGISAGMFSVLHGVALSGLPYADYKRIVSIFSVDLERGVRRAFTAAEAAEGLIGTPGFEHIAYYNTPSYVVLGRNGPLQTQIANVSAAYFSVFGVPAALGRTLNEGDFAEIRPVGVLSHAAWMALTGGDPDIIGRALTVRSVGTSNTAQLEVVGVLAQGFEHPRNGLLYRPWDPTAQISSSTLRIVSAVGKLAPNGAETAAQALQTRLTAVQEALGQPETGWQARYSPLMDELVGDVSRLLLALFAVSLLVLLIACSTASSLISIRFDERRAELAVRRTLGAGRARAALEASLELIVLAALGTLGGIALAHLIVAAVQPFATGILPRAGNIGIDGVALGFAIAAAVVTASLSAAFPLLRTLGEQSTESLHRSTRRVVTGGRRLPLLPAAGIGLAAVALVTALALTSSLHRLASLDPGFRTKSIAALEVTPPQPAERARVFLDRALEELRAVPGVLDAAASVGPPPSSELAYWTPLQVTTPERDVEELVVANVRSVSSGYHRLLGIPLLGGRDIGELDTPPPSAVMVNETLARRLFGDTDPVGEALLVDGGGGLGASTIVGVVADTRNAGLRAAPRPEITFSLHQLPTPSFTLLVSALLAQPNRLRVLEDAIRQVDPNVAIVRSYMLDDELGNQMRRDRFFAAGSGWFAMLALLLSAIGINAVIAAMQRLRTREIGVRLALGAAPRHAAALVLVNAARIVALGAAIGMLLAVPAVGALRHVLFGVEAGTFWGVFGLTTVVLITVAIAAAGWPAWRASRTAPMEALRYE